VGRNRDNPARSWNLAVVDDNNVPIEHDKRPVRGESRESGLLQKCFAFGNRRVVVVVHQVDHGAVGYRMSRSTSVITSKVNTSMGSIAIGAGCTRQRAGTEDKRASFIGR
jgi:hypothetical protein